MIAQNIFTKSNIFRSGVIYSGSLLLSKGVGLAVIFIIVYFLSVYEYGLFKLILSLVAIFQSFIISGLDAVVRNDIAIELRQDNKTKAAQLFYEFCFVKLLLTTLVWVIFYLFISLVFVNYYENNFIFLLKIASITIFLNYFSNIISLFYKSIGALSFTSMVNSWLEIVKVLILVTFFYFFSPSIQTLFGSIIVTQIITIVIYGFFSYKILTDWWQFFKFDLPYNIFSIVRTYGKWSVMSGILSDILPNARNYLIKILISTEAVAIYNIAKSMLESLYQLLPMNKVLAIFLPYKVTKADLKIKYYKLGVKYSTYLYFLLIIFGYIGGTLIIDNFFVDYQQSLLIFYLMLPILLLFGLLEFLHSYLHVLRFQKILFMRVFLKNILSISLIIILVPIFGLIGLGYEYIITNIIILVMLYKSLTDIYPELSLSLRDFILTKDDLKMVYIKTAYFYKRLRIKYF